MKISILFNGAVYSLHCQTGYGDTKNQTYAIEECPTDGQIWACQNEVRVHGSRYWVQKVSSGSFRVQEFSVFFLNKYAL